MYINDRDQINYHGFLKALRDMHQASQIQVCKGICSVSGMNRFENGNRVAEKLMRDRLTSRLGISGDKYEDYLLPREYDLWQHRMRIVKAIKKNALANAKEELHAYENLSGHNRLNQQFVETMRYMILALENAPEEERLDCITKAIKYTVPNINKALDGEHLLADQEINMMAEYMRLNRPTKAIRDINEWRISEYEKLIKYMDNSRWEKLLKAKVYPKVVCYIGECMLQKESTEDELRHVLEQCNTAIELLRDTSRLYYFIELTELRRFLIERLMHGEIMAEDRESFQELLIENNSWEDVLKGLYTEYQIPHYMQDFCYLYFETECHNMVEVIEARRTMLGLSRVKLGCGLCTERTIIRFEREGRNPTVDLVRSLFDRMGMCAEYRRAPVVTTDAAVLTEYYKDLTKAVNDADVNQALETLRFAKERIDMDLPFNRQEMTRVEKFLLYKSKRINEEDYVMGMKEALSNTLSLDIVQHKGKKYYTITELLCIQAFAFNVNIDISEKCIELIKDVCFETIRDGLDANNIALLEMLMLKVASKLGDEEEFEKSNEIGSAILKECLANYRTDVIPTAIYNNLWNNQKIMIADDNEVLSNLIRCVLISKIIKKYNVATFFQKKLELQRDYSTTISFNGPS